jgi:hypothetical protein
MFDDYAAEFSEKFYAGALDRDAPLTIGAALLRARQHMANGHPDDPTAWAVTTLWGNPWVRLLY